MAPIASLNLAGRWLKDFNRSDLECFSRQLDLLGISGIKKTAAVKLINGRDIKQTGDDLSVSFIQSKVSFLKQTEQYSLQQPSRMKRRDGRQGEQVAAVKVLPDGVEVTLEWPEPKAGLCVERYKLADPDTLELHSLTQVGDDKQSCVQYFTRQM
jgi:hypothetical protein